MIAEQVHAAAHDGVGDVADLHVEDEVAVAQLVAWCRIGPPRADVTGIEVTEEPVEGLVGFRVR